MRITAIGKVVRCASAREHLRAILYWAWEQELIDTPPRFPAPRDQRDVAGRHYLTKAEINALYFATHKMGRPRGWDAPHPIGRYWRAALVVFFNYGVDTGTVWKSTPAHEPILWRHVIWDRKSPDREAKERSPWGWLFYRRVKTDKAFYRPMNRVVHAHLRSIMPEDPRPTPPSSSGAGRARTPASRRCAASPASSRGWTSRLESVALRVGRPAEPAIVVVLDSVVYLRPGSSELGQHGVEVPDAIIDHERCRARTEVGGVRRERRPNRLLSSRGRRESPVGLLWFDGHAQVFAIPGGERLGIARFEEYTANSNYLFHANPFSSRLRTCDSLTKTH